MVSDRATLHPLFKRVLVEQDFSLRYTDMGHALALHKFPETSDVGVFEVVHHLLAGEKWFIELSHYGQVIGLR